MTNPTNASDQYKNEIRQIIGIDEEGNLAAHVAPRVDTLANLLLVADAGDGEIATASDVSALVVYRGDPSIPEVYSRFVNEGYFKTTSGFNSTTLAAGVKNHAVIDGTFFDTHNMVTVATNIFNQQLAVSTINSTVKKLGINLNIAMLALALPSDITQLIFELEKWNGSAWVAVNIFSRCDIDVTAFSGGAIVKTVAFNSAGEAAAIAEDLRVAVSHDSASSFAASFEIEGESINRFGGEFVVAP